MSASREAFSRAASKAGSLRRPILFEERIRLYRLWVVLEVALGLIPELMLSAPRAPPPRPTTRVSRVRIWSAVDSVIAVLSM